jgi:hypothetical protein
MCGWGAAQSQTGYRLEAVTVRKLEFENDAFAFGDKLVEKWYETVEQGGKKGVLVVVTTGKDGALTGGPDFMKARLGRRAQWAPRRQACSAALPDLVVAIDSHILRGQMLAV